MPCEPPALLLPLLSDQVPILSPLKALGLLALLAWDVVHLTLVLITSHTTVLRRVHVWTGGSR